MDIQDLRKQIDAVDDQLVQLFVKRMDISAQIAAYKKNNKLPIFVPEREAAKLDEVAQKAGSVMESYTRDLYATLFVLSRHYQMACMEIDSEVV